LKNRGAPESGAGRYPPEWLEQSLATGVDPVLWATTSGGAILLAVWEEFPDATPAEYELAAMPAAGEEWLPTPQEAVGWVRALRDAEGQIRRGFRLSGGRWQRLARHIWPNLSQQQRRSAEAIVEAAAEHQELTVSPLEARGFTADQIRRAAQVVRRRTGGAPTIILAANELGTSEATLKRAMKELDMGPWPPAAPTR
jgi:hypothetical protein